MNDQAAQVVTRDAIDIMGIMENIPHRFPFLLVDRVEDIKLGESCVGIKNVTINEYYFQGHFPRQPIMPGVLIVEAMAQTAGVLVVETIADPAADKVVYFMTIEDARFRKPVVPGDTLKIHVNKIKNRGNVWKFSGEARVDGVLVAEARFAAMITDD